MPEDAGKVEVRARSFFPTGPTTPEFQSRSDRRRQEVEDWLEEEWEDIPPVTQEEVQQEITRDAGPSSTGPRWDYGPVSSGIEVSDGTLLD